MTGDASMFRFVALAWDGHDPAASATAHSFADRLAIAPGEWRRVLDKDGLIAFRTTATKTAHRAYLLSDKSGVILGNLFGQDGNAIRSSPDGSLSRHQTVRIRQSRGQSLVEQYWGRYVALLSYGRDQGVSVVRDPTGALPCLVTRVRGVWIACSTIEERLLLGHQDLAINWPHIASYLCYDRIITDQTGFDDVRQVRAGESLLLHDREATSVFHWSPARLCSNSRIEDYPTAVEEIRRVVRRSVNAWASCYGCILHELSGGLDSTVVLSCLSDMRPPLEVICQNYFTDVAAGDERHYARRAAESAGVKLIETSLRTGDCRLVDMFESTRVATPVLMQMVSGLRGVRERLARKHRFDAIFSGQGGDHLFQHRRTLLIAADYAWEHGIKPRLARIVVDAAHLTGRSVWAALECAITNGLLRRPCNPYAGVALPLILSTAGRDMMDASSIRHPWVEEAKKVPNGKRAAIASVIDTQNFYHLSCSYADVVHPLISQPLMELCLRIPSYVLTHSGIDRALVRDAFRESLPPEIAARTGKGCTTSYFHALLARDLTFLRGYLMDGILASAGMLDLDLANASLRESALIRNPQLISPLLNAVRAEVWLRGWNVDSRQQAA